MWRGMRRGAARETAMDAIVEQAMVRKLCLLSEQQLAELQDFVEFITTKGQAT